MKNLYTASMVVMCLVTAACESPDRTGQETAAVKLTKPDMPVVYSVNYPLAWMAGQIAGDRAEIVFPAPADIDPAHWQPSADDILLYQQADRVLLNGVNYASWIGFAALSSGRLVDTTAGMSDRFVPLGNITHTHGPTGQHEHGDVASHTWLDPTLAEIQAGIVADTLIILLPEEEQALLKNASKLAAQFDSLDVQLAAGFSGWAEQGILYSHPVYQYLDNRFVLNGRSLVWEPDQEPTEEEWQKLAVMLKKRPAKIMLWEAEPSADTVARLAGYGITSIVFEVSGNRPQAGDYLLAMDANLKRMQAVR